MDTQNSRGYREPRIPTMQTRITQGVTPMAYETSNSQSDWQPTVLYLMGLILAEFALLAALRYLPKVRG